MKSLASLHDSVNTKIRAKIFAQKMKFFDAIKRGGIKIGVPRQMPVIELA